MAGIYVHIPFCRQKCHYCNFFSIASSKSQESFFEALKEEIRLQHDYLAGLEIGSIYIGGGTPSFAEGSRIAEIIGNIKAAYPVAPDAEVTVEINPDDADVSKLRLLMDSGVNRISIGIQSFSDQDLVYLNRVHSARQSMDSIRLVQDIGFTNISIDLIYGIPTLPNSQWEKNLELALRSGVPHISAYSLTVEPKTGLDVLLRKHAISPPREEDAVEHFKILTERMGQNGFVHYEISNFCKEGYYSVHNSNYWKDVHYLGLGPSAHSYNGVSRQWNVSGVERYIEGIRKKEPQIELEYLTPDQKFNEYVMVSLRTIWGCDIQQMTGTFGQEKVSQFLGRVKRYLLSGEMERTGNKLFLTRAGMLFADAIASDLFIGSSI